MWEVHPEDNFYFYICYTNVIIVINIIDNLQYFFIIYVFLFGFILNIIFVHLLIEILNLSRRVHSFK